MTLRRPPYLDAVAVVVAHHEDGGVEVEAAAALPAEAHLQPRAADSSNAHLHRHVLRDA